MQYVLFTDNLADLTIDQVCMEVKRAGFDGIDLTLRPGGHVLPRNAEMGLSEARTIADRHQVTIPMASTAISDVDSPHAEAVVAACAHYGVKQIKLGYWRYEPFGKIQKQIDAAKKKLEGIVKLTGKYHVQPCVHVHSGDILANGGPLLYLLLQDFSPDQVGAYVDPMHMTVEGGLFGWEIGLDLLVPWVSLVGIKNFRWQPRDRNARGQMEFRTEYVPIADGQANLPRFMDRLREIKYDGVVSLHSEYKGRSSFRTLNTRELLDQSATDLQYLKSLVG
jgi:sugar phosphate isomerase/epimerase